MLKGNEMNEFIMEEYGGNRNELKSNRDFVTTKNEEYANLKTLKRNFSYKLFVSLSIMLVMLLCCISNGLEYCCKYLNFFNAFGVSKNFDPQKLLRD